MWDEKLRGPWTLEVSGLVKTPLKLTLDDLMKLPARQQRVDHFCVEGWTAIAAWTGVRVSELARRRACCRMPASSTSSFDDNYHESGTWRARCTRRRWSPTRGWPDARTQLHGAPARVHSPVKLGYKNTKYLTQVVFLPKANGGYWSDEGYEWFGGV